MPPERDERQADLMHRVIMKTPPGMMVDHIYLNGLDNRKRYLRNGTKAQNSYNRRPRCSDTGFKGVKYVAQTGKYEATGRGQAEEIGGEFDDPIEAAKARDRVAREVQGEFAYLNFPDDSVQEAKIRANTKAPLRYVGLSGAALIHSRVAGRLRVV